MFTTCATRNPALILASGVMGTLVAAQRSASGGIQAPILTHVTWSALMLRYLAGPERVIRWPLRLQFLNLGIANDSEQ